MAYGIKYKLRVESVKFDSDIFIEILENGYAGEAVDKYLGAGGIILTKDSNGVICGTSLAFTIQADSNFEYIDLANAATRQYMVKLYRNVTIYGEPFGSKVVKVNLWQGYLISDSYQEEFIDPPYDVQLTATDGLGLLKNYAYTSQGSRQSKVNRLQVLFSLLAETGLDLNISVAYEMFIGADSSKNLFSSVYFNDSYFNAWTCYDVLAQMLPPDCTITQHNAQWLIRRNDLDSEATHRVFTDGTPIAESTGAAEVVLNLAPLGSGDCYPINSAELQMDYAWKSMNFISELGKQPSALRNHDFSDGLTHWTASTTGFADTYITNDIIHLGLDGNAGTLGDHIYQAVESWDNHDDIVFELEYCLRANKRSFEAARRYSINGDVKFQVSITDEETTYYLNKETGWTTEATYITESIQSTVVGQEYAWKELKIYADSPPIAGTMTLKIYRFYTDLANVTGIILCVTNVVLKTTAWDDYNESQYYEAIPMRDNGVEEAKITVIPCDLPDVYNADLMFYNGQYDLTNARINEYTQQTLINTYTNHLINSLIFSHATNRHLISGIFRGENLTLNSILQVSASNNRKFYVRNGSWDLLNDRLILDLLEIPGSASGSSWVLGNTDWTNYYFWSDETRPIQRATISGSGRRDPGSNNIPGAINNATQIVVEGKKNFHGVAMFGAMNWSDENMKLTIASGNNIYWFLGESFQTDGEITCEVADYFPVPDNNTLYFLEFSDADGRLEVSDSFWDLRWKVPVAMIYTNNDGNKWAVAKETHNHTRNIDWHINAHLTIGTRYYTGLGMTYPDASNDNKLQIETGIIYDEDLANTIGQTTGVRAWYQVLSGVYTWVDYDLPYPGADGDPHFLDTDDYTLKSVDDNRYVCYWYYASNDIHRPIYVIPTQSADTYVKIADARLETPPALTGLALNPEWKLIWRVIYKGDGQYQEKTDYRNSSSLPAGGTASVSAGGVTFVSTGNIAATNVQVAIQELDDEKADKSNVLLLDNTDEFVPDADYEPATKKYVDDWVAQSVQGTQGLQGTTGETGVQGTTGATGSQGTTGETGLQGTQGIQGTTGTGTQGTAGESVQGTQGIQGTTGTGTQGTAGESVQGTQGIQGTTGTGTQGTAGESVQGTQGIQGDDGEGTQGTQGTTGRGAAWLQGTGAPSGALGQVGDWFISTNLSIGWEKTEASTWKDRVNMKGDDGSQGTQGTTGTGTQGTQGPAGAGSQGTQGIQGTSGTGSQGIQGTTGAGSQGIQGTTGAGSQGIQGIQGTKGIQGIQGTKGIQGTTGAGSQGIQGTTGAGSQGIQGTTGAGSQGIQGIQGTKGIQGIQGTKGIQGTNSIYSTSFNIPNTETSFISVASEILSSKLKQACFVVAAITKGNLYYGYYSAVFAAFYNGGTETIVSTEIVNSPGSGVTCGIVIDDSAGAYPCLQVANNSGATIEILINVIPYWE